MARLKIGQTYEKRGSDAMQCLTGCLIFWAIVITAAIFGLN